MQENSLPQKHVLGIDIGGTGIKSAIVDIATGELITEKLRIATPQPATPERITNVLLHMIAELNYNGDVGICFPAVVKNNIVRTANNIGKSWIGTNLNELFGSQIDGAVTVCNDADMAGYAEVNLGAGRGVTGKVMVITIGTGLGSGMYYNGRLIPNMELGSLPFEGDLIERYVSKAVKKEKDLTWEEFGNRLDLFLRYVDQITNPDLIIIGGGYSKKYYKYKDYLSLNDKIEIAQFGNNAGIIGAAMSTAAPPFNS